MAAAGVWTISLSWTLERSEDVQFDYWREQEVGPATGETTGPGG